MCDDHFLHWAVHQVQCVASGQVHNHNFSFVQYWYGPGNALKGVKCSFPLLYHLSLLSWYVINFAYHKESLCL